MLFKAVAFDLDGTLVIEKSSWFKLHKHFGTYAQSVTNMKDYEKGKINYNQFMRKDISLWKPQPKKAEIERVLLNYTLGHNVKNTIGILKKRGYILFIVTTAPDILAEAVAKDLGISQVACNNFVFNCE